MLFDIPPKSPGTFEVTILSPFCPVLLRNQKAVDFPKMRIIYRSIVNLYEALWKRLVQPRKEAKRAEKHNMEYYLTLIAQHIVVKRLIFNAFSCSAENPPKTPESGSAKVAKFQPGNVAAAKTRWPKEKIIQFQNELRSFRERLNLTEQDLEHVLSYESGGRYLKMLEGQYGELRQPSERFLARLAAFKATSPSPRPPWNPHVPALLTEKAVPASKVLAHPRQCLECLAKAAEGRKREEDAWFFSDHPSRRVHPGCHRDWRRRKRWFRRCQELGCTKMVPVAKLTSSPQEELESIYTCLETSCPLRRWRWLR